jgi:DNA mismatch repair ATPase MutS
MEYIIFGAIILILIFLAIQQSDKGKSKSNLNRIRLDWGNPKSKIQFQFGKIRRYADVVPEKFHRLTDQTIEDIDFQKLFAFIDRTTSKVGQQFLYKKVTEPSDDVEHSSEKLINLFNDDKALREDVQLQLLKLSDEDAYHISSLLRNTFFEKPKWFSLLVVDIVVVFSLLVLSIKFPVLLIVLIIPFTINMFVHLWNKNNTFHFTWSIPQLNLLINVSKALMKRSDLLYNASVEESILSMKSFQRNARLIRFSEGGIQAELGQYLVDIIKAFFLIEVFMLFKVIKELRNKQSSIKVLFGYVGNIDAAISIASLRAGKLKTCKPIFVSAKKELTVENIYHPLIRDCVRNSLTVRDKSVLITGSNMSGKSTFLRTLAINSILAQTIHTCFADEYISPVLKQFTSIRIDDNLFEGTSYYFQEVNIIGSLIAEVDQAGQNLFLLDEVFKGTNTIERIAAAKAILSYLNRRHNIVIVSTHDIELADMLTTEYDLYHFTETIESAELHFDHKIKPGQLRTRNGIKLLELANYPSEITSQARQISLDLSAGKLMRE